MEDRELELFELLEPEVGAQGLGLVEVSLEATGRKTIVRLVIHAEAGVTHGDCARATRAGGAALEASDAFPGEYILEVSSPGMERVLKSGREFEVFRGRRVRVRQEGTGSAEEMHGRCAGTRGDDAVALRTDEGEERILPWASVKKARLVPEEPATGGAGGKER